MGIRITNDGSNKRDPIFIAQGKTLVYCLDEKDDLIRADLSDPESEPVPLFDDDRSHQTELAYSPDERFVSFSECVGNLTGKLVIRDLGSKKDVIINHSGRGAYRTPVFTVDGKRVIYAFAEKGPMQLWSVDLEGKNKKQLTETSAIGLLSLQMASKWSLPIAVKITTRFIFVRLKAAKSARKIASWISVPRYHPTAQKSVLSAPVTEIMKSM